MGVPDRDLEAGDDINLVGVFLCCNAIIPYMLRQNYGRIVNVASIAGKEGNANASAYSASKAGVIALTKSLGKETANQNIAVNCITPAAARTRIFDQITQEHIDFMLSRIPRGRFLEVNEVSAMVAWLVSEENSFTTGAVFDISGGRATKSPTFAVIGRKNEATSLWKPGKERPAMLDASGAIRDLSGVISDIAGAVLFPESLEKLRLLDTASLPVISGAPRLGPCVGAVGKFVCIGLNYSDMLLSRAWLFRLSQSSL